MNGNNKLFLQNPKVYLDTHAVECYNIKAGALESALKSAGESKDSVTCGTILEFDLVPQPGNYVSLIIVGGVGSYKSREVGEPVIVGSWMPYLNQIDDPDINQIGRIDLTGVPDHVHYVFTVGLGGCNFVACQDAGRKMLYHEPTNSSWKSQPAYPGVLIRKAGPAYDEGRDSGFGMAMRDVAQWKLLFQLAEGVKIVDVTEYPGGAVRRGFPNKTVPDLWAAYITSCIWQG